MKIGKGQRRFGGPSQAFLERKGSQDKAAAEAKAKRLPDAGPVNLFLDDERLPREGWTLVRTPKAFQEMVCDEKLGPRIRNLSLDWDLGRDEPNGEVVAKDLAARLIDPAFLPNLEIIHFHSSVHERALDMLRSVQEQLGERYLDIYLDIGKPWND